MRPFGRAVRALLVQGLLISLVGLTACGRGEEAAPEAGPRAELPAPRAEPEVPATAEAEPEASAGTGLGGLHLGGRELPRTFPEQMPIPEGAEVFSTFAANQDGRHRINVGMRFEQGIRELETFFAQALPEAGWTVTGHSETSARILQIGFQAEGFDYQASISLAQLTPDRVTVSYGLTTDPQ